jgi:hypothetical protein
MRTPRLLPVITFALLAAPALAQNTATLWWEVNDGSGWQSGDITTTNTTLQVRRMASWNAPAGTIFAGTFFDATITTVSDTADSTSDMRIAQDFNLTRGLSAFRFGNLIKIDQTLDSDAPGAGSLWLNPYNEPTQADPNRNNPVMLVSYTLNLTPGAFGLRTISEVHGLLPLSGANTTDRVMYVWLTQTTGDLPITTRLDARINYIPTPGSLALIAAMTGLAARRRR